MVRRVILGSSSLAASVASDLAEEPGDLVVVTDDESRRDALTDAGIDVREGDPSAPDALAEFADVATVAALDADGAVNRAALIAARDALPAAHRIGYTGDGPGGDPAAMAEVADQVLDPGRETTRHLMDRLGDVGSQVRQLYRVLRGIDRLAVLAHDNPDPDAIASAVAVARIAAGVGCEAEVCYFGDITHQENRAFVNLLEYELRNLDADETLEDFDGLALVDHSRPGVNDQLPEDTPVDIVIDHHPPRYPVDARFVDLRSEVGATSTLLVDYLQSTELGLPSDIATGLLFGIRVDTDEFSREVSVADFEAAATLLPHADLGLLEKAESPSISGETMDTIAEAIRNRRQEGPVLLSSVGRITARDALAQAADRLLTLDGVTTTVVFGLMEGTIYVSARSRGTDVDLGETLRDAFDQIGSAGGHADMAGAQITLGVLETVEDQDESLLEIVESVVVDRFIEALEARSAQTISGLYAPDVRDVEAYLSPEAERPDDTDLTESR
jgi:nanoRNase/pAp phosphatase (c-di-AMP/oligoRNAs hydrolase)